MSTINYGGKKVDVADPRCGPRLKCFFLFADKGTFVQGRGYTSYRKKEQWVCGERHLRGCPKAGVCEICRSVWAPYTDHCERDHSKETP